MCIPVSNRYQAPTAIDEACHFGAVDLEMGVMCHSFVDPPASPAPPAIPSPPPPTSAQPFPGFTRKEMDVCALDTLLQSSMSWSGDLNLKEPTTLPGLRVLTAPSDRWGLLMAGGTNALQTSDSLPVPGL